MALGLGLGFGIGGAGVKVQPVGTLPADGSSSPMVMYNGMVYLWVGGSWELASSVPEDALWDITGTYVLCDKTYNILTEV